ncbi:MAG: hypothetical protein PHT06_01615 [Dehalococcoidales bacterium]|nr:hypothetical protein [Dehalococcoidales bacterium]
MGNTATGLQENIAALLCYVLGWITGLIFFLIEPNNRFIRFHAMQSIIVFGIFTLLSIIFNWLPFWFILWPIISILAFVLWVILIVKAYQWIYFKLPLVGDLAEKWANK